MTGYYKWGFSDKIRAEIETCLNCPLPDCKTVDSPKCPLWLAAHRKQNEQDLQSLIREWWAKTNPMSDKGSYGT